MPECDIVKAQLSDNILIFKIPSFSRNRTMIPKRTFSFCGSLLLILAPVINAQPNPGQPVEAPPVEARELPATGNWSNSSTRIRMANSMTRSARQRVAMRRKILPGEVVGGVVLLEDGVALAVP